MYAFYMDKNYNELFTTWRGRVSDFDNPDIVLLQAPCWGVNQPSLSLAFLSSVIRKNNHKTLTIDINIDFYNQVKENYKDMWNDENAMWFWTNRGLVEKFVKDHDEILDRQVDAIIESGTKLVGFTVQLTSIQMTLYYCQKIKAKKPDIIIVFGGPHAARFPHENFGFPLHLVDALVEGEGEDVVLEIIERIQNGQTLENLKNVMVRLDNTFNKCDYRELIFDFDKLPYADFSDMDFFCYRTADVLPFFSSRGCPNKCIYCNEVNFWTSYRSMSPARIVDEIEYHFKNYPHLRSLFFHDSLINGNIPRLVQMADLIIERKLRFTWASMAVVRKEMRYELFHKLKLSGCYTLAFGLESSSESLMMQIGKTLMRDTNIDLMAQDSKRADLRCTYNFMFGVPGETEKDFQATLDFLTANHDCISMVCPSPAFFGLVPGTASWDEGEKYGIIFDPMENAAYWTSPDGKNNLLVRLERFERFCKHVKAHNIKSTYPFEDLIDRDKVLGGYYYHINEFEKAINHLAKWIDHKPDDQDAKLKLKLCMEKDHLAKSESYRITQA